MDIPKEVVSSIPANYARFFEIVPHSVNGGVISLIFEEGISKRKLEEKLRIVSRFLGKQVGFSGEYLSKREMEGTLRKYYPDCKARW